jgi:hypothetical protein
VGGARDSLPSGKPGREAGARAPRKSPEDREDGGGLRGRGGGDPRLFLRGHLGQAPCGPGQRGRRWEFLSAGPDFSAQSSSRNARAKASPDSGRCRPGSKPGSAFRACATPGWSLPCPRPKFLSPWNKDEARPQPIPRPISWSRQLVQPESVSPLPAGALQGSSNPPAPSALALQSVVQCVDIEKGE